MSILLQITSCHTHDFTISAHYSSHYSHFCWVAVMIILTAGCRCWDLTKLTHISVLDDIVIFQELLNLFPLFCCFIFRGIAHSITHNDAFHERCFDCWKHKFDESCGGYGGIGTIDCLIIPLLMVMDDGLHREPGKNGVPLRQQQCVLQPPCPAVAVGKGVDQFKSNGGSLIILRLSFC